MTLYLLDANVLIRANEDYYPIDRIPRFWTWLEEMGAAGLIKVPPQIYGEITPSRGPLSAWLKELPVKEALLLDEPTELVRVQEVIARGYAPDLNDVELEAIGQDPFLVAAALGGVDRVVVTKEVPKPRALRGNRKIPDVCAMFGIVSIDDFELYRRLNFTIG
jgi:Domain of unknown function (DUF4411)